MGWAECSSCVLSQVRGYAWGCCAREVRIAVTYAWISAVISVIGRPPSCVQGEVRQLFVSAAATLKISVHRSTGFGCSSGRVLLPVMRG